MHKLSIVALAVAAALGCGSATRGHGEDDADAAGPDSGSDGGRPGRGDASPGEGVYNSYFYAVADEGVRSFAIDADSLLLTDRNDPSTAGSLCNTADPAGRFVFIAERQANNTFSYVTYAVDVATGRLARVNAVASTHRWPSVMAVNAAGTFLFVGDVDTSVVASYSIDQVTGVLSAVNAVTVNVNASSYNEIQIHPSGRQLYVGSYTGAGSGQLRTINVSTTGVLSLGPTIDDEVGTLHLEAARRFLFTGPGPGSGSRAIHAYRVDPNTGALTFLRTLDTGGSVTRMVSDPDGRFLYVGRGTGQVVVYSIAGDGTLMFASQIALTDPGGAANVFSLSFHPTGGALYVHSRNTPGDNVHALRADPQTGALTSLGPVTPNLGGVNKTRAIARLQP